MANHFILDTLDSLRSTLARLPSRRPEAAKIHPSDITASITGAVGSVPDGMAASVIIGVAPVHGLYASIVGPIIGGLVARTPLLLISTTSASALSAAELVRAENPDDVLGYLLLLTLFSGLFQVLASLAGLARLVQFVSHSVMTGFLLGIATLIVLGQLGTLLGYSPEDSTAIVEAVEVVRHLPEAHLATLGISALTFACLLAMTRSPLKSIGSVLALAVATTLVAIAGFSGVQLVSDVSEIPGGLPSPAIPDLGAVNLPLLTGALSLAVIVFVQTAGVSQGLPRPPGRGGQRRDIAASGLANVGAALFQGQPVGGSLGQSALNVQLGARTRLASILSGVWIIAVILLLGSVVERVPMASLAALLVIAAIGTFNLPEVRSIWQAGWTSRATVLLTFGLTLFLPLQIAVGGGVLLSAVLCLSASAADVRVVELVWQTEGLLEREPPARLSSRNVTILQVYGSLFFAGARTLARRLPAPEGAEQPVVVLRLRGQTRIGATLIDVLSRYARELEAQDGRLFMAGLSPQVLTQLAGSDKLHLSRDELFGARALQGESVGESYEAAAAWLVNHRIEEE